MNKKAEIAAIIDYCDPDLMLFTETKIDSSIFFLNFSQMGTMVSFVETDAKTAEAS